MSKIYKVAYIGKTTSDYMLVYAHSESEALQKGFPMLDLGTRDIRFLMANGKFSVTRD